MKIRALRLLILTYMSFFSIHVHAANAIVISDGMISSYSAEKFLEYLQKLKQAHLSVQAQNPQHEQLLEEAFNALDMQSIEKLQDAIAGNVETVQIIVLTGYTEPELLDYLQKLKKGGYKVVAEDENLNAILQDTYENLNPTTVKELKKTTESQLKKVPVELSAALIEKYSDAQLEELLEQLKDQGYEVKGQTPKMTQELQEAFSGQIDTQEIQELKKDIAALSPQPPAPPFPVPPAPPIDKKPIKPITPIKPDKPTIKDDILPALSQTELDNLSEKQKNESDSLVKQVLTDIAQELFLFGDTKVESKILKPEKIENSLQAYTFFMMDALTFDIGRQETFKKRDQLRELLGLHEDGKPQLQDFIDEHMTKKTESIDEFLSMIHNNLEKGTASSLVTQLRSLMQPLFFNAAYIDRLTEVLSTYIANIALTQRPITLTEKWEVRGISPAQKVESDGLATDILEPILRDIQKELPEIPEKRSDESEDAYQARIKDLLDRKLSKDYLAEFGMQLNMLRLNPEFFNFFSLLGHAAKERAARVADPVVKLFSQPLLSMIQASNDPGFFKPQTFLGAMRKQVYFNPDDLKDVVKSDDYALRVLLNDHTIRMLEARGKLDIDEFLTDRILNVKDISGILSALTLLEKSLGKNEYITAIQGQLSSLDPNEEIIMQSFKKLVGKDTLTFASKLQEILQAYMEKTKTQRVAINVLKTAKGRYKETQKDQGAYILQELQSQLGTKLTVTQKKVLTAIDRTAQSVKRLFDTLAGADRVKQVATIDDFYAMIAPYGLMLMVLQDIIKEGEKLKTAERLTLIFDSLNSLQDGTIITGRSYVTAINQNQEIVTARVYKGKLTEIINALKIFDINMALAEIANFVKQAGVGVEQTKEFKDMLSKLRAFLVPTFLGSLLYDLQELNAGTGEYVIKGLELEGQYKRRNASIYRLMSGYYTSLLNLLSKQSKPLSAPELVQLEKDAYEKDAQAIAQKLLAELQAYPASVKYISRTDSGKATESKEILTAVEAYIDQFTEQLDYIIEAAQDVITPGGITPVFKPGEGPPPPPSLPSWRPPTPPKPPQPPKPPKN